MAFGKRDCLTRIPTDAEWDKIYTTAEEQTVVGLMLSGIEKLPREQRPPQELLLQWIGVVQMIEQQNRAVNKELAEFASICEKEGLEYIVVKGQTVGCLYPKPLWRQPGDIDFLVHGEGCMVQDYGRAMGVEIPKMVEKEVCFDRNDIRYELHTSLRGWWKKCHQRAWDELMSQEWKRQYFVEIDGVKVRTHSPTVNAAYVFIHLFFHFMREGVSLRQVCDWAMVLHHYREEIERDELLPILKSLDMFEAFSAFGTILVDKFGMPLAELPVPISREDRKWQEKILKDVFAGGNFGKLNHDGSRFMF